METGDLLQALLHLQAGLNRPAPARLPTANPSPWKITPLHAAAAARPFASMEQAKEPDRLQAALTDPTFAALDRNAKRALRLCSKASRIFIDSRLTTVEFSDVASFESAVAARTRLPQLKRMLIRGNADNETLPDLLVPSPSMCNLAQGVMTLELSGATLTNTAHRVSSGPGGPDC